MKITIIGGGNMGGAIARGLVSRGVIAAGDVTVSDPSQAVRDSFALFDPAVNLAADNREAIDGADIIIIAVKPWLMEQVCASLAGAVDPARQMVASIAAGITFAQLSEWLGFAADAPVRPALLRIIPNTAIALGESVTFIASSEVTEERRQAVGALFEPLGKVFMIDESEMTAATALASCGIAYALRYIDAAARGGDQLGIPFAEAQKIVMQTVKGALALLETNGAAPQTEIDKVTTPGGITLKGLDAMEQNGFSDAVINGLKASR